MKSVQSSLFAKGRVKTKVVVDLVDDLADVSALEIQTVLHNSGLKVVRVHASNVVKQSRVA